MFSLSRTLSRRVAENLFIEGLDAGQTLARSSPGFGSPSAALIPLHPNRIADHGPLSADLAAIRRA
jgi:hypothetical protein